MSWIFRYFRRDRRQRELEDEIASYMALTIDDNVAAGMTEQEARQAARRKFGNTTLVQERVRDMNTLNFLEDCANDLRHGARLLKLNPGFFVLATLSLALGIGANTAIFQLLNAVRLRSLPVAQPEQLVELRIADNDHCCAGNFSTRRTSFTNAMWEQIRSNQQAFSGMFAFADSKFNLADRGEARFAEGFYVSGGFFATLGVRPALGRLLTEEDDRPGCGSPAAVISYAFWQREFGGEAGVVGRKLSLERHPVEVVGVSAAGFFGPEVGRSFDVAVPICADTIIGGEEGRVKRRDAWWLAAIGRLKPGWTLARAKAQVEAMSAQVFENSVPENFRPADAKWFKTYKLTAEAAPSGVSQLREDYERPLWLLFGIAGAVLLIACANLANLMLARSSVREREMAVRIAIGAGRGRLVRQLLAESALLTLAGTVLGALLAGWLSHYLVTFISTGSEPLFLDLGIDWRMLSFTSAVAILTCLLFGIAPALRAASTAPGVAMKSGGRAVTADRSRFGLRRALVVVQVALSLVLLTGALLFGRSLHNLTTVDTGLRGEGLFIARTNDPGVAADRRVALFGNVLERLRGIPGVTQAAAVGIVPLSGSAWNPPIEVLGEATTEKKGFTWFNRVSPEYFKTMGMPMLAGRDFNDRDTVAASEVAVVTQKFADRWLKGGSPIGKQFRFLHGPGEEDHVIQIVGLVRDSKSLALSREVEPLVFLAVSQDKKPRPGVNFVIRSNLAAGSLTPAMRAAILAENADTSIVFQMFETQVLDSILRERLMATLSGFFGLLAAVLASVGLYGVISYMVAKRRNEIGIRVALGASQGNIVQLVIREATVLVVVGIAIGTGLALAGAREASSLVFGLQAYDPATIGMAVGLLLLVSLLASCVPAMRAARLDPVQALRED